VEVARQDLILRNGGYYVEKDLRFGRCAIFSDSL
jgi:hypothetical protein